MLFLVHKLGYLAAALFTHFIQSLFHGSAVGIFHTQDTPTSQVPLAAAHSRSSEEATTLSLVTQKRLSRRKKWQQVVRLESCLPASFLQRCPGHITAFAEALLLELHKQPKEEEPATFMTELQGPNPFGFLLPELVPRLPSNSSSAGDVVGGRTATQFQS